MEVELKTSEHFLLSTILAFPLKDLTLYRLFIFRTERQRKCYISAFNTFSKAGRFGTKFLVPGGGPSMWCEIDLVCGTK